MSGSSTDGSPPLGQNTPGSNRLTGMPATTRASAGVRILTSALAGAVLGVPAGAVLGWGFAPLVGWVVAAVCFLVWTWAAIWPLRAGDTARLSRREEPSVALTDALLLLTSVAAMLSVALVIGRASHASGSAEPLRLALGIASVVGAWAVVHTVYALRYAREYYAGTPGGMNFHSDQPPAYRDFLYVAFTVGMTFQVSDTEVNDPQMRSVVLRHALVSFLFGAVIIAVTINLVAGLSK